MTWQSSDADGDELFHVVSYSIDGGQTFIPLAIGLTENQFSFEVPPNVISNSVLVKVIATDGINTSKDTSDSTFSIVEPTFLIIDEDSIDNGSKSIEGISFNPPFCGNGDPAVCVNDDIAKDPGTGANTVPLFSRPTPIPAGTTLTLTTGQIGDEALFSIEDPINAMGDSLANYWNDLVPKANLDPIFGPPLRTTEIQDLAGKVVCGLVYDSDVSNLGNGQLGGQGLQLGSQGAQLGRIAFKVTSIGPDPDGSQGSVLPPINIAIIDPTTVLDVCRP